MKREECLSHGINFDVGVHRVVDNINLYEKFLRQFPSDPSFNELVEALRRQDAEASFQAAHKLKGVTANLAIDCIYKPTCILVEELRKHDMSNVENTFPPVKKAYEDVVDFLKQS